MSLYLKRNKKRYWIQNHSTQCWCRWFWRWRQQWWWKVDNLA